MTGPGAFLAGAVAGFGLGFVLAVWGLAAMIAEKQGRNQKDEANDLLLQLDGDATTPPSATTPTSSTPWDP